MFVIRYRKFFLWLAVVIVVASLGVVKNFGIDFGIDFTGGSLVEVTYTALPDKAQVEEVIAPQGLGEPLVRRSDSSAGAGYLITIRDMSIEEQTILEDSLVTLGEGGVVTRFTSIGPVIGEELKDKAVWALGAVLLIILVYVAFAFTSIGKPVSSWIYASFTILVLGHDILVPIAAMSLLGYFTGAQVDILFVTALLTILGYSVNDTIVIFDRVREKLIQNRTDHKTKVVEVGGLERTEVSYTLNKPFDQLVGQAVSETMARSINTSLTVLLALIALYVLGSSVTQTFVFILMAGVLAGAFSSIFIASPLLVTYALWLERKTMLSAAKK